MTSLKAGICVAALAVAFGGGWATNGWRIEAGEVARLRKEVAKEREARAETQKALVSARANYFDLQKEEANVPNGDSCGFDPDRVRLLPRL